LAKIIYIGSIQEYLELEEKKSKDPDKYKSIEIIYDLNKIRKEVKNKMIDQEKKFTKAEAKINIYMKEHPGATYREAVLGSGLKSSEEEEEIKKEEYVSLTKDEVLRSKKLIEETIYNLSLAKKSDSFNKSEQEKLDKAYILVKEVEEDFRILVERNI